MSKKLIKKVFDYDALIHYAHETANTIQIDSIFISILFKHIICAGNNSHHKQIPNMVFNVSSELRQRYLIAYLSGDGNPSGFFAKHLISNSSPTICSKNKYSFVSASKRLIEDFSYLLFTLNKTFSVGETHGFRKGIISINYKNKERTAEIKKELHSFKIDFY